VSLPRALAPILAAAPLWACASAAPPKPAPAGYLGAARAAELAAQLAPPPAPGSSAEIADAAAVRLAAAPEASTQWLLAQADAELDPGAAIALFDCAVGADLEASKPPALIRLFTRELEDAFDAWTAAKARFAFRPKPDVALGLKPCTELAPGATKISAYPAGHAVTAQLWSRTVAALAPDRAQAVAAKALEIGESRVACATQYPSDVAAGEALGAELFEAVQADPAFQADLADARAEVAAARAAGLRNPACPAEQTEG
jgi:acid phosphatase (class A)